MEVSQYELNFLARTCHDFKNSLTIIYGVAQLLETMNKSDEITKEDLNVSIEKIMRYSLKLKQMSDLLIIVAQEHDEAFPLQMEGVDNSTYY